MTGAFAAKSTATEQPSIMSHKQPCQNRQLFNTPSRASLVLFWPGLADMLALAGVVFEEEERVSNHRATALS